MTLPRANGVRLAGSGTTSKPTFVIEPNPSSGVALASGFGSNGESAQVIPPEVTDRSPTRYIVSKFPYTTENSLRPGLSGLEGDHEVSLMLSVPKALFACWNVAPPSTKTSNPSGVLAPVGSFHVNATTFGAPVVLCAGASPVGCSKEVTVVESVGVERKR